MIKTTLDTDRCRGFFLSAQNTDHPFVRQHGTTVIVLARSLNKCWERFVFVKELMHLFDGSIEMTDTGEAFERQLSELQFGGPDLQPQTLSEFHCFWMALACLCPEHIRTKFAVDRDAGRIDDYAVALQLRIPQLYVPRLFEDRYDRMMERLLETVVAAS